MRLIRSNSFKQHKKLVGQNNHFLITIFIGLDGIADGKVTKKEEFRTSWNPDNINNSVIRSRHFAITSTMAYLVDSLDTYFSLCYRKPKLLQNEQMEIQYTKADKSVYGKFNVFKNNLLGLPEAETAIIELIITWRNRLMHFLSNTPLDGKILQTLYENKDYFYNNYQHLEIDKTISNFNKNDVPTFKEITSFVRASLEFVNALDTVLLKNLDLNVYIKEILSSYISEDIEKRLNSIWSTDKVTKERKIIRLLLAHGLEADSSEISLYSELTYKTAKEFFCIT
jgi:hypothetical protein